MAVGNNSKASKAALQAAAAFACPAEPSAQAVENLAGGGCSRQDAPPAAGRRIAAEAALSVFKTPKFRIAPLHPAHLSECQWRIMLTLLQAKGARLSRAQIARRANCCEQTVKRAMPKLAQMRFVQAKAHFAPTGQQLPNSYKVTQRGRNALAPYIELIGGEAAAFRCLSLPAP